MLLKARAVESLGEPLRLAGAQSGARDRVLQRHAPANQARRQLPGAGGELELSALQQLDDQRPGRHQRATTLGDHLKDRLQLRFTAERPGDLDRRIQRLDRPFKLKPPRRRAAESLSVIDRHPGELRQQRHRLLVIRAELRAILLLGEIQIPVWQPATTIGTPRNELIGG